MNQNQTTIPTEEEKKYYLEEVRKIKATEGLTIESACKKVGLALNNYYVWQREFRKQAERAEKAAMRAQNRASTSAAGNILPVGKQQLFVVMGDVTQVTELLRGIILTGN